MSEELFNEEIINLTDEEGNESAFELIGSCEFNGSVYYALVPADEDNAENEYVILKSEPDENGEELLVTIEDDDEFESVADIFEDELFSEVDYDDDDDDDSDDE